MTSFLKCWSIVIFYTKTGWGFFWVFFPAWLIWWFRVLSIMLINKSTCQNISSDYVFSSYKQHNMFGFWTCLSVCLSVCLPTNSFRVFFGGPYAWSWSMTSVSAAARSKRRTATSANIAASRSACQWACPTTVSPTGQGRAGLDSASSSAAHARTPHAQAHTYLCMLLVTCKHTLLNTAPQLCRCQD